MTEPKDNQKNFTSLFALALVADFLCRIALATGDEVWEHLAMLWLGPLDDIAFGLAGVQAFLYLLDPKGEKTLDEKGAHNHKQVWTALRTGSEREFARNFTRGSARVLMVLPALLGVSLVASVFAPQAVAKGVVLFSVHHLSLVLPVSVAMVAGLAFLRLGGQTSAFWKSALAGGALLLVAAAVDGRWQNHLYHMIANLENLLAWAVTLGWAGFCAVFTEEASGGETA